MSVCQCGHWMPSIHVMCHRCAYRDADRSIRLMKAGIISARVDYRINLCENSRKDLTAESDEPIKGTAPQQPQRNDDDGF